MKYWRVLCLGALLASPAFADFRVEAFMGTANNFRSRLAIYQSGYDTLIHDADYCTCPLQQAPYYSFRVGWWDKDSGWEIEMLHHKITLRNTTNEIARFRATFGYNMFLFNRAWLLWGFNARVGMGLIIAHPSNTIRGQAFEGMSGGLFNGMYFVSGVALQVALQRRFPLWGKLYLNVETKITAGYANLPVHGGLATTPNFAVHGLGGLGYSF